MQIIFHHITGLKKIFDKIQAKRFLLVCGSSYKYLGIKKQIDSLPFECAVFSGFSSNPLYEEVCRGIEMFRNENCDVVLAIGGGSAIDVGKCIKLWCKVKLEKNYLTQQVLDTSVPLIAIPTTAGTGSESTRYAVIYYEGQKQSIMHDDIVPNYAILDHSVLKTLPIYQKKCTMLDALCQGIESWWSVHSTDESKTYAKQAVGMIIENMDAYLVGSDIAAEQIMLAANFSGRAINISQTTAAHAMSYKLTSIYGLPHGHAVALCLPEMWEYMLCNTNKCVDERGEDYLKATLDDILKLITPALFRNILEKFEMKYPFSKDKKSELSILTHSVNPVRLKNNPVMLEEDAIFSIYERILK